MLRSSDRRKSRREYLRWLRLIRREVSWKTEFAQGETVATPLQQL